MKLEEINFDSFTFMKRIDGDVILPLVLSAPHVNRISERHVDFTLSLRDDEFGTKDIVSEIASALQSQGFGLFVISNDNPNNDPNDDYKLVSDYMRELIIVRNTLIKQYPKALLIDFHGCAPIGFPYMPHGQPSFIFRKPVGFAQCSSQQKPTPRPLVDIEARLRATYDPVTSSGFWKLLYLTLVKKMKVPTGVEYVAPGGAIIWAFTYANLDKSARIVPLMSTKPEAVALELRPEIRRPEGALATDFKQRVISSIIYSIIKTFAEYGITPDIEDIQEKAAPNTREVRELIFGVRRNNSTETDMFL